MSKVIPHLSRDGWMKNPTTKLNKLFEYFITSNYSQSNTYYGEISSLKYILEKHSNVTELRSTISYTLTKLYKRHYNDAVVSVDVEETDNAFNITITIIAIDEHGDQYKIDTYLNTVGNIITNIEDVLTKMYEI